MQPASNHPAKVEGKALWILLCAIFTFAVVCACAFLLGERVGLVRKFYTYSDHPEQQAPGEARVRQMLWSPPREVPWPALGEARASPAVPPSPAAGSSSPTVGTLVLAFKTKDDGLDIFERELLPAGWSPPRVEAEGINSPFDETTPWMSPDGRLLYFSSNRPGGLGGMDLYASRRTPLGWESPRNLGSAVNSPYDETGPALHPSGRAIVFSTTRPRSFLLAPPEEWSDFISRNWRAGPSLLASAARPAKDEDSREVGGGWSTPRILLEGPRRSEALDPCFAPTGEFLYFSSNRPGGLGGFDLHRAACRASAASTGEVPLALGPPENLGAPLNSAFDERSPALFLDGSALAFLASDARTGTAAFFESRTREVEPSLEFRSAALRALAANMAKLSLLALSGAILVAAPFLAVRYWNVWRPGLLGKCALAALFTHALMFYSFYFWVVSDEIIALAKKQPPAPVSVERVLEAKLSLEARRLDVDLPGASLSPSAASLVSDKAAVTLSALEAPSPLEMEATPADPPARPEENLEPRAPQLRFPELLTEVEIPDVTPKPWVFSAPLEAVAPAPETEEPPPPEARGAVASLKVDSDAPRPGPLQTVECPAESPPVQPGGAALEAARTQVQAPETEILILPPLARPASEPPPALAILPVPAQTMEESGERISGNAPEDPRLSSGRLPALVDSSEQGAPRIQTTEAAEILTHWRSESPGLPPALNDIPEAFELPASPRSPAGVPLPAQGSPLKLPEALPRSEVAAVASASDASDPSPPRRLSRAEDSASFAASDLTAPKVVAESGPLTAPSNAAVPVLSSSPALLDLEPRPGSLSDTYLPQPGPPGPLLEEARLPETGDLGARPSEGSGEAADILSSATPRARAEKATLELGADLAPRAAADSVRVEPGTVLEPSSWRESLLRAPARNLQMRPDEAEPTLPGESRLPPVDLVARSPEPIELTPAALKLPERPPEAEGNMELGTARSPVVRKALLREMGGNESSEDAVSLALQWLAKHQSPEGYWDVDGFDSRCGGCRSPGFQANCDAAITGLALLGFLAQNHTHKSVESPYRSNVRAAVDWLVRGQEPGGSLAQGDERYTMYGHGIATLALSEAYILTRDETLRAPLQRAANLILASQNTTTGGWRYLPQPPIRGDTSITGWQVLALTSLSSAGFTVPEKALDLARHWFDVEVAGGHHGGIFGYSSPEEPRVAMVAEGMYARFLLGARRTDRNIEEAARYIHTETRNAGYLDNLYLVYYGSLALYNYQGWIWERWNLEVRNFLVKTQHRSGTLAGSWDPNGPWSEAGGRVLSTCFATLALEVYYRYLPLYWRSDKPEEPASEIR